MASKSGNIFWRTFLLTLSSSTAVLLLFALLLLIGSEIVRADASIAHKELESVIAMQTNSAQLISFGLSINPQGPNTLAGDYQNDTNLDTLPEELAGLVGMLQPDEVYQQTNLPATSEEMYVPTWSSPETDNTRSVAWGDWDGDGDLDLAVGNGEDLAGQPIRVYANSGGDLALAWTSPENDDTRSVAWGDWDGDGDLDLAVGNYDGNNRVYANSGGDLTLAWTSLESYFTTSVAWGDWDGDGDLDLAVGNNRGSSQVYANSGGVLTQVWLSPESGSISSIAWGDWDGDGHLDLAVGNGGNNWVYANSGGNLTLAWTSPETDNTRSVGVGGTGTVTATSTWPLAMTAAIGFMPTVAVIWRLPGRR